MFHLCVMRNEGEGRFYGYISYEKINVPKWRISLWGRGHWYEHFKIKNQFTMKIERVTCIWMFVHAMNFELPEMAQKWNFGFFRHNLPQLGLFHPYFVSKSSFGEISMIKMVILEQSKPISLYLKIKKSKIKKAKIRKLHV